MTKPAFFTQQWASAVGDALTAGPPPQARAGKLQEYWDFIEQIKTTYPASWALRCRDRPAQPGKGPARLLIQWAGGTVTSAHITGPDHPPQATYGLSMDYPDWKALHDGYDAQRTIMYRKILLEDGDLLQFFKGIYFFAESLAIIGAVPATYPAPAPGGAISRTRSTPASPSH